MNIGKFLVGASIIGLLPYFFKKLFKLNKPTDNRMKILFVLKSRNNHYGNEESYSNGGFSSGLNNSVLFMRKMLTELNIDSKVVEVFDSNGIDKEIHKYKPTHCICEAIWVPPYKFRELKKLHKNVQFFVRLHSDIGFIAGEGVALGWIHEYINDNVTVTANSRKMVQALRRMNPYEKIPYTPNYYPIHRTREHSIVHGETLDIFCPGAIRILKNTLNQAVAAIIYCIENGKKLRFHINSVRKEGESADPVVKNIVQLFKHYEDYGFELIHHGWYTHSKFLEVLSNMDLVMQVSYTETFNIVLADAVSQFVPVLGSTEIPWLPVGSAVDDPNDVNEIVRGITKALEDKRHVLKINNIQAIAEWNSDAIRAWKKFLHVK